jgi:RND family efflux transporter MFP subunit
MKKLTQLLLVLAIIAGGVLYANYLIANKEEAKQRPSTPNQVTVEIQTAEPTTFNVNLSTRGSVSAKTQGDLVAQVSGQIIAVSANLREGQTFLTGEVLAEVDPRDYQAAVAIGQADLASAEQQLAEEQARSKQAARDWARLNIKEPANDLMLRKPQLAGAKAAVKAAQARLMQAELALERTKIRAPYSGIIRQQLADLGQFLTAGKPIASIFSQGAVEIRLPLTASQYRRLPSGQPAVTISVEQGRNTYEWQGQIVRRAGALDLQSRQLFVIAEVEPTEHPLPVGQFVEAQIDAVALDNVITIPRTALYEDRYVWVANDDNTLRRAAVVIAWKTSDKVIVSDGLATGDKVVITNLPLASNGSVVQIADTDRSNGSPE